MHVVRRQGFHISSFTYGGLMEAIRQNSLLLTISKYLAVWCGFEDA